MKERKAIWLKDRPGLINQALTAIQKSGMSLIDINYHVVDTDEGDVILAISVESGHVTDPAKVLSDIARKLKSNEREDELYEQWFRKPSVWITVLGRDYVGFVATIISHLLPAVEFEGIEANILSLKGFAISDMDLYAVKLQVATQTIDQQAVILQRAGSFSKNSNIVSYDAYLDNYIWEECNGRLSSKEN